MRSTFMKRLIVPGQDTADPYSQTHPSSHPDSLAALGETLQQREPSLVTLLAPDCHRGRKLKETVDLDFSHPCTSA